MGNPNFNTLIHEVCVGSGWCGGIVNDKPSHIDDFIPEAGLVSAERPVECLFQAVGVDPSSEPAKWARHKDALREAFVRHPGADIVDASAQKWDVNSPPLPAITAHQIATECPPSPRA